MILSWIFIVEWRWNSNFDGGAKLSYQLRGVLILAPFSHLLIQNLNLNFSLPLILIFTSIFNPNFNLNIISNLILIFIFKFNSIFSIFYYISTSSISSIYSFDYISTSNIIFSYNFDGDIKFNTNTRGIIYTKSLFMIITISRIKLNLITITTP